ncbi:MAG: dynamin family protein [Cyclobacteriaceae bacterium]|nr:dynamin family protein [Cyclobacteriaceae bacterium]
MQRLVVNYNPNTYNFTIESTFDYKKTVFTQFVENRKSNRSKIVDWSEDLFKTYASSINENCFEVCITCDDFEKLEIERQIDELANLEDNEKIEINANFNIVDIDGFFKSVSTYESYLKDHRNDLVRRAYEKVEPIIESRHKSEVSIVVAATMSAGKSTVLNALIGKTLLPSKNEATTATICKLKINNSLASFRGSLSEFDKELFEDNIDANWISEKNEAANNPESDLNIYLEGPVSDFDTNDMDIFFVDTPGPNNSQNNRHKEATYTYLKDEEKKPILIYILNATQLRTNDELHTLNEISKFLKKNKASNDRIIFVLNRIDDLDPEKEPLNEVISKTKQYLKDNFEIANPKIFPVSAEYARIAVKASKDEELSRNEKNNLLKFQKAFKPDIENNYSGVATFNYLPVPLGLKQKIKNEIGVVGWKDDLIYSGLYGLKQYIQYYIKHQQSNDMARSVYDLLDNITAYIVNKIDGEIVDRVKNEVIINEYSRRGDHSVFIEDIGKEMRCIKPNVYFLKKVRTDLSNLQVHLEAYLRVKPYLSAFQFEAFLDVFREGIEKIQESYNLQAKEYFSDLTEDVKNLVRKHYSISNLDDQICQVFYHKFSNKTFLLNWNDQGLMSFIKKNDKNHLHNPQIIDQLLEIWTLFKDGKLSYSAVDIKDNVLRPVLRDVRNEVNNINYNIKLQYEKVQKSILIIVNTDIGKKIRESDDTVISELNDLKSNLILNFNLIK